MATRRHWKVRPYVLTRGRTRTRQHLLVHTLVSVTYYDAPFAATLPPDALPVDAMPRGRTVDVRSADGTRIHTEVFGPEGGYPIVLAHGITCAIRVWANQIADLAGDYRVIAYDHRGHGRSDAPKRRGYGLDFLAADLDAVLDATLVPGERAVIAGHSMGGIAITSWSQRYPARVGRCADAVALINTTTGDLLRDVKLLPVPRPLSATRVRAPRGRWKRTSAARALDQVDSAHSGDPVTVAVGRAHGGGVCAALVSACRNGCPRHSRPRLHAGRRALGVERACARGLAVGRGRARRVGRAG